MLQFLKNHLLFIFFAIVFILLVIWMFGEIKNAPLYPDDEEIYQKVMNKINQQEDNN